jgi:hypothetical protein
VRARRCLRRRGLRVPARARAPPWRAEAAGASCARGAPQTIVAYPVKALRQDVLEEAPHELVRGEGHDGRPARARGLVAEGHVRVGDRQDIAVRDGAAIYVAGDVPEHGVRGARRRLAVDAPRRARAWRYRSAMSSSIVSRTRTIEGSVRCV